MRYGILGDIHANLSALEAALEGFRRQGVEQILSVGDVIGYGAAPRECIRRLREIDAVVVKGNHDAACVDELDVLGFNEYAREAVAWTKKQLRADDTRWLRELPLVAHLEHCSVAHGTLHRPERFDYVQSTSDGDPSLDVMEMPVCFVGHTHVPVTLLRLHDDPLRTAYTLEDTIDLSEASRALVNVGSVGQPRDEDARAAYATFDTDEDCVRIHRTPYDIEREAARIREAGLPAVLADRLFLGI
jgi:diadenosine tetraphosphatase ApaH/serine/threonine PP2A family protein phosphatase